jgi:hypothetical protein
MPEIPEWMFPSSMYVSSGQWKVEKEEINSLLTNFNADMAAKYGAPVYL